MVTPYGNVKCEEYLCRYRRRRYEHKYYKTRISRELIPENPSWLIVHHLSHRDRQPKSCVQSREPASAGFQRFSRDSVFPEIATYDNRTLTRKPLETAAFRRPSLETRHASNIQTFPKSSSDSTSNQPPLLLSQPVGTSLVRQSKRKTGCLQAKRSNSERARRSNHVNKELKALLVANERWNRYPGADNSAERHSSQPLSPERHVNGINKEIFFEKLPEVKETELKADQKCFKTDCCTKVEEEVVVPSWRIVKTKRRYVIEQTENLGDEVFKLRHQKPEIDEKRRKRWDEQRQRDQKLFERQNRKDQTLNNVQAVTTPRTITTDNESKAAVSQIKVIEAEPILAFGHFIASIPPREFSLPRSMLRRSKTAANRSQTSRSSRKRNWK